MDGLDVQFHGVAEFNRAITEMNARVDRQNREAVAEAGRALAVLASARAPKGATGALAKSVIPTPVTGPQAASSVKVGPTVDYGRRVELGFKGRKSVRGKRKRLAAGVDTGRRGLNPTPANPFLKEALAAFVPQFEGLTLRQWAKAIRKP